MLFNSFNFLFIVNLYYFSIQSNLYVLLLIVIYKIKLIVIICYDNFVLIGNLIHLLMYSVKIELHLLLTLLIEE